MIVTIKKQLYSCIKYLKCFAGLKKYKSHCQYAIYTAFTHVDLIPFLIKEQLAIIHISLSKKDFVINCN